jgi:bacterial/archaeal transporter family protein
MKAILIAVLAGLCWGIGEVFTKSVLHTGKIGPVTAIAVRTVIALPFLWLAYWWFTHHLAKEPRDWMHADGGTWAKLIVGSGLIAGAGGMICFYAALNLGEVSRIKPVAFAIAPATGVVLGWLALGESMNAQKALAIVLILIGVVLLTGNAGQS